MTAAGVSSHARTARAADRAFSDAADQLADAGAAATVAFVFFSAHHVQEAGVVASCAREHFPEATIAGCSAEAVVAGAVEYEDRPGVAVLACAMPGVCARAFALTRVAGVDPTNAAQVRRLGELAGMGEDHRATILLADPFALPVMRVAAAIDRAAAHAGGARGVTLGGLASASRRAGGNAFLLNDTVVRDGGVGLSLSGPVEVGPVVSQGCRPLGPNMVVTAARGNIIHRLGGRRAFDAVRQTIADMDEAERHLLSRGLFLGVVADEHRPRFGPGDYAIRSVLSADEGEGSIAVGDYVRVGQTVRLHARDAASASDDLELLLDAQKLHDHPAGCLLFTCNGRGTKLFDGPNHDAAAVRRAFERVRKGSPSVGAAPRGAGQPMPIAGFFAAGEIGPIQGRTLLHGHTACAVLFRTRAQHDAQPDADA